LLLSEAQLAATRSTNLDKILQLLPLACVLCLFALGIVRALILYAKGVPVIAVDRQRSLSEKLLDTLALTLGTFWIIEVIAYALPGFQHLRLAGTPLFKCLPLQLLAAVLLCSTPVIYALALFSFGKSWRIGIDRNRLDGLATGGIFACTRNPIYLSFDIFFVGTFALEGRLVFLVLALCLIFLLHLLICREESFLVQAYGQEYLDYCKRTARYIGF
jgi:protein-S-isoprenylcysteine O-methyltransferase Ste14